MTTKQVKNDLKIKRNYCMLHEFLLKQAVLRTINIKFEVRVKK